VSGIEPFVTRIILMSVDVNMVNKFGGSEPAV
jgi:hypothetical protein